MSVSPLPESESVLAQPSPIAADLSLATDPDQPEITPSVFPADESSSPETPTTPIVPDPLESAIVFNPLNDSVDNDPVEPDRLAVDLPPLPTPETNAGEQTDLTAQKQALIAEIADLTQQRDNLNLQIHQLQTTLGQLVPEALQELQGRKRSLQQAVEQLERRQERIQAEMRQSFAGVSQELAIRVQSFKDYLVGSLQDLVVTAEDLNLVPPAPVPIVTPGETTPGKKAATPQFGDDGFKEQTREIRRLLDQYRTSPDYYGPPWQLRRTFEPIHAERVNNWFFEQGGRGAIRGLGSRLQNVLVASAIISVLNEFYGEQLITLVLANTPESLGEWRRGLQDCLGISRADFGPNQGVALYEDPEPLVQKADRLVQAGDFPLVIIDEAEEMISLSLLQFPLWLAFAADPRAASDRF